MEILCTWGTSPASEDFDGFVDCTQNLIFDYFETEVNEDAISKQKVMKEL